MRIFTWIAVFSAVAAFANMAKPWVDGSTHSVVFTKTDGEVRREWINIDVVEKEQNSFYAKYEITYEIFSKSDVVMPLRFIGLDLSGTPAVTVNSMEVVTKHPALLSDEISRKPGIVLKPSDEFLFDAKLHAGVNRIVISYVAVIGYDLRNVVRKYSLKYALYPSRFWKSFGPIEIKLKLPADTEYANSNIGKPNEHEGFLNWTINASDVEEFQISFERKKPMLARIMIFFGPSGMASLVFILLGFCNVRLLASHPKRSRMIFWLGILIVPASFYLIFIKSALRIDASMNQFQNHGYGSIIVLTWPVLALLYAFFLFRTKRKIERGRLENA